MEHDEFMQSFDVLGVGRSYTDEDFTLENFKWIKIGHKCKLFTAKPSIHSFEGQDLQDFLKMMNFALKLFVLKSEKIIPIKSNSNMQILLID